MLPGGNQDDQRVTDIHESAELLATLPSAVQREVYGGRVAEAGKITPESMKLEIGKAYKRLQARKQKQQEKIDLAPAQAVQPKIRSVRYDNVRSAVAEETVISLAMRDPALMDCVELQGSDFSVPLFGQVYEQMRARHKQGLEVSLSVLSDLSAEEMSHMAGIVQNRQGAAGERGFRDCATTIRGISQVKSIESDDDLLAFRNKLLKSKGTK